MTQDGGRRKLESHPVDPCIDTTNVVTYASGPGPSIPAASEHWPPRSLNADRAIVADYDDNRAGMVEAPPFGRR